MPTKSDIDDYKIYTLEEWMNIDIDKKPTICSVQYDTSVTTLRSVPYSDCIVDRYIPEPTPPIRYRSTCAYCGAPINDEGKCEYCGVGHQYLD